MFLFANVWAFGNIATPNNISEHFRKKSTPQLGFCISSWFSWRLSYLNFSLLHFITPSCTRFPYQTYSLMWKWPEWKCKRDCGEVENLSSRIHSLFLKKNWKIIPDVHWSLHSIPALAAKLMTRLEELCKMHPTTYLSSLE